MIYATLFSFLVNLKQRRGENKMAEFIVKFLNYSSFFKIVKQIGYVCS